MKLHQNEINAINDVIKALDEAIGGNASGFLANMHSQQESRLKRIRYQKMIQQLEDMLQNHKQAILDEEECRA